MPRPSGTFKVILRPATVEEETKTNQYQIGDFESLDDLWALTLVYKQVAFVKRFFQPKIVASRIYLLTFSYNKAGISQQTSFLNHI